MIWIPVKFFLYLTIRVSLTIYGAKSDSYCNHTVTIPQGANGNNRERVGRSSSLCHRSRFRIKKFPGKVHRKNTYTNDS